MSVKYLIVGDTHGDLDFIERAAEMAAENDAEIIQVGDMGVLWPAMVTSTMRVTGQDIAEAQLTYLSTLLARAGEKHAKPPVTMRWVDGNHDWHTELRRMVGESSLSRCLGVQLSPNVIYQPRGSTHEDVDGTRFLFVGGAPSIDRANRTAGRSWWPEEVISEQEFEAAMAVEGPIHVMVTHDAPDYPVGYGPKGSKEHREQSARSMEMIRMLVHKHEPEDLFHGHWHERFDRRLWNTRWHGLGSNYSKFNDAVMLWSRDDGAAGYSHTDDKSPE